MDYKETIKALLDAEANSELDCEIHELRPALLQAANAIESLQSDLEQVKAERDILLGSIEKGCYNCKHWRPKTNQACVAPDGKPCNLRKRESWDWSGLTNN